MCGILPGEAHKHIGYLHANRVLCLDCGAQHGNDTDARLYFVNVYPYRQTCHACGALMCRGQSEAWCELFPRRRTWVFDLRMPEGRIRVTVEGTYREAHRTVERDHGPFVEGGAQLIGAAERLPNGNERTVTIGDISE